MYDPKVVGQRIKEARKRLKWTQTDLANRLKGSRHKQSISNWENGQRAPSTSSLRELARVLSVNFTWLVGENKSVGDNADILKTVLTDDEIYQLQQGLLSQAQTRKRVGLLIQEVLKDDPDNIALIDSALNVITRQKRKSQVDVVK